VIRYASTCRPAPRSPAPRSPAREGRDLLDAPTPHVVPPLTRRATDQSQSRSHAREGRDLPDAATPHVVPPLTRRATPNPWLLLATLALCFFANLSRAQLPSPNGPANPRVHSTLSDSWRSIMAPTGTTDPSKFTSPDFNDAAWTPVNVPHNWDTYAGYRHAKHGNTHGVAWYRRSFTVPGAAGHTSANRRVFLFFEGVGSYATVWVNGREVGRHAGGLTTFTLDVTDALNPTGDNVLAVRAEHPSGIRDLPWVCGGCERAHGFSEGSQPFGIFRPVHVQVTDTLRIEPFGVHVWNNRPRHDGEPLAAKHTVEVKNYGAQSRRFVVRSSLLDREGRLLAREHRPVALGAAQTTTVQVPAIIATGVRLWSLEDPYQHTLRVELLDDGSRPIDQLDTPFGFRWIDWPSRKPGARTTLLLNGKPVFLNGTCEYSHLLGGSHAFSAEQISARVQQIHAAGFNAFRDAHHPHDLRYQDAWDRLGLAWWTQFGAHIWFDRDDFRTNFLALLREWVRERRNSPSLMLWGLQNESQLPADFAAQCTALIRQLDPTAVDQRLVTTCNGGAGTDWDVPQNWTGTYGGDPKTYPDDLRKQILVGEYGAWRSLDLRAGETAEMASRTTGYDEDAFNHLLNTKIKLAQTVRGEVAGHFQWIFSTHDNPGRNLGAKGEQVADGWHPLDQLGPANNKGLLTLWGEPLDMYYIYRAHYAPAATQPMVVIGAATRPDSRQNPDGTLNVTVYSNCEQVELFDGVGDAARSLGKRNKPAGDVVFQWTSIRAENDILRAVALREGQTAAEDLVLTTEPARRSPRRDIPVASSSPRESQSTTPATTGTLTYVYRVNCGGPDYVDAEGNRWLADRTLTPGRDWGSTSWAVEYPHLPPALGSLRRISVPIAGTNNPELYRDFRYGRQALTYTFSVPDGEYEVELHLVEPWYGRGNIKAEAWRLFDVAINGETQLQNVDVWKEAGYAHALVKRLPAVPRNGRIELSFPRVASYQAVIAAIAIARRGGPAQAGHTTAAPGTVVPTDARVSGEYSALRWSDTLPGDDSGAPRPLAPPQAITDLAVRGTSRPGDWRAAGNLRIGHKLHATGEARLVTLPGDLSDSDWLRTPAAEVSPDLQVAFTTTDHVDLYVGLDKRIASVPAWLNGWTAQTNDAAVGDVPIKLYRKHFPVGSTVALGPNGKLFDGSPAMMYGVFARPVRAVQRYAPPNGASVRLDASATQTIWSIDVGVGSRYGIVFDFRDPGSSTARVRYELTDRTGKVLCTEERDLVREPDAISAGVQVWRLRTCSSINAGTYQVRLTWLSGAPVEVLQLTVE
jgi:beta-galactosidase